MSSKHVSLEELEAYFLHHTNDRETETIEEHLLICERCQDTAAEEELNLAAIRAALRSL
jgi:hypothetical protein